MHILSIEFENIIFNSHDIYKSVLLNYRSFDATYGVTVLTEHVDFEAK